MPITQKATNRSLDVIPGADGLKTGYIDESGYNLSLTVLRDGTRLISVTMGGPGNGSLEGNKYRTEDSLSIMDWGFALFRSEKVLDCFKVNSIAPSGKEKSFVLTEAILDNHFITIPNLKDENGNLLQLSRNVIIVEKISAPINCGHQYGKVEYYLSFFDEVTSEQLAENLTSFGTEYGYNGSEWVADDPNTENTWELKGTSADYTVLPQVETDKLVKDNKKPGTNVTGTTDMNPIEAQLDLALKLVPNAKAIGTIYCSSEVNSQLQVDILKAAAKTKGVEIKEATVSTANDIQQAARSLVGKVDALYIPTDNILASAMPTLSIVAGEAKLPVVCGEGGMVKAGGTATLGIDYYKLGVQTGEMAADILAGKAKPQDMAIQSQKDFEIVINEANAKKIGLNIPEEIMKKAAK